MTDGAGAGPTTPQGGQSAPQEGQSAPQEDPATPQEAWARYLVLLVKVTDFWDRAVDAQPRAFACRAGCAGCCLPGLSVLPVEAAALRAHLAGLADPDRERLLTRLDAGSPRASCAFLADDLCLVYPARPVICRTHGLALRVEDRVDHCPLCYTEEAPRPEAILSLETLNTLLVLVNRHWLIAQGLAPEAPRVALEDLAREAPGGPASLTR